MATNTYTPTLLQPGSSSPMVLGSFSAHLREAMVSHEPGYGLFVPALEERRRKSSMGGQGLLVTMKLSLLRTEKCLWDLAIK